LALEPQWRFQESKEGWLSRFAGMHYVVESAVSMSILFDGEIGSKIDGFAQRADGSRFRSQCDI